LPGKFRGEISALVLVFFCVVLFFGCVVVRGGASSARPLFFCLGEKEGGWWMEGPGTGVCLTE